ncbi:MAG: hypothetical protein HC877_22145 [Thioploca sp.]|nr:hypothetical protein [Thioploca sp.]
MDPAYVHLESDQNLKIKQTQRNLEEQDINSIGRYAASSYSSIEDLMLEAKKTKEKMIGNEQ